VLWHAPMAGFGMILSVPLAWLLSTSLKAEGTEFLLPPRWIPEQVVWANYPTALTTLPFHLYLWNTLVVAVLSLAGTLLTASMAAFAFARLRFPGRSILFTLLLSTLMLPQAVTLIPKFIIFRNLDWVNTLNPLWVPWWFGGGAFFVFLLRQFLMTLPHELDEAARIDGAGDVRILWQILVPLCKPVIAAVAIFAFLRYYDDFMGPLIYLNSNEKYPLSLGVRFFAGRYGDRWQLVMAVSALMLAPVVVLFFVAQRQFIRGIQMTGLAGR